MTTAQSPRARAIRPISDAVLLRRRIAHGIRNVDCAGAGGDHRPRDLFEETRLRARAVFRRELDVVHMLPRQLDRRHRLVQHLLLGLLQLVLQMDLAGGDEGVDARPLRVRQRPGGPFHIERTAARQGGDVGPREFAADCVHRFEIAFGSDRESRFEDVHAEFHQLARHPQFLRDGHAAAGRLLAVAECRIENVYAITHAVHR